MKYSTIIIAFSIILSAGTGMQAGKNYGKAKEMMSKAGAPEQAIAVLHPTEGNDVTGAVIFTKMKEGIKITADVKGLSPGKHGFHIHEYGDCSAPDATSAGGHYNPGEMPHAAPGDMKRHVGDLGNLVADASGKAHYERIDKHISFKGPHSIIGLAVIVHKSEDDLTTQPTGAAGPRLACGVIGISESGE